jgi:hypothetical protein
MKAPEVGGCVTIAIVAVLVAARVEQRMRDAQQSLGAAVAECKDRHESGDLKTQRETALCMNKAQHEIMGPVEPYRDLLARETSYRLVLADQVDRKEISSDQADALFAKFYSELETEARNRNATQAQINNQNAQAAAAVPWASPAIEALQGRAPGAP